MQYRNNKIRLSKAMTLLETIIAMALMAIIFAALVPQFRLINNSWDSKVGASETLQNGRVLINHLNHNLSKASRITAVSDSSETNGYIEFIDNDANNVRYDVNSTTDYVEFGLIGSPSDLAGPVSQLQFTCYDAYDLDTPITDINSIRNVKVET
ncbi:MAG: PilW family protein, partial [Planctomycetota bacterium]